MHPDASSLAQPKRRLAVAGIIAGSLLTLSPLLGVLGTVLGMTRAFSDLADSGIGDPNALSSHIGQTLLWTATGFFLLPVGLIVLIVSIVFYVRRRPALPPPLP